VVALAYVLQLPYVLAAIVGVRLGGVPGADHRRDSLRALALELTAQEKAAIDAAVARGRMLDGLART
jgi:aryl-alcohol dehydrogenase-like predicted oxidoreductase